MKWLYITNLKDFEAVCTYFSSKQVLGIDIETGNCETGLPVFEPREGDISLFQMSDGVKTVVIDIFALWDEAGVPKIRKNKVLMYDYEVGAPVLESLKSILTNSSIKKVIHNAKFENKWFYAKLGVTVNPVFDSFLAAMLVDYNSPKDPKRMHNLGAVMRRYVGEDLDKAEQTANWGERPLSKEMIEYAAYDVIFLPDLRKELLEALTAKKLLKVAKLEFDAVSVVAKMEVKGLKVNREEYEKEIHTLEKLRGIAEKALQAKVKKEGELVQTSLFGLPDLDYGEVSLTSAPQMKEALSRLNIPVFAKKEIEQFEAYAKEEKYIETLGVNERLQVMKETYPKFNFDLYKSYREAKRKGLDIIEGTGAKALLNVNKGEYDVIGNLKEFRGTEKLVSSYGEGFLEHLVFVEEGHERVHSSFKQIGAPTGRFSSSNPNVQQVPAGRVEVNGEKHVVKFRECFDFPKGYIGVNADYSQIELRIAADQSGDKNMIDTFKSGRDLHADTASRVFGVEYELCAQDGHEYHDTYRKYAKSINFGILYGMGSGSLSAQVDVSLEEAQEMIDKYAEAYPQLWDYLQKQKKSARNTLQARTASGRLQVFDAPDKDADEDQRRKELSAIGRNGMNMPIQGTSADILKRALKLLDDAIAPYDAYIVNTVHDEITVEVKYDKNAETVRKLVEEKMIEAAEEFVTKVPIKVDAKIIENWASK